MNSKSGSRILESGAEMNDDVDPETDMGNVIILDEVKGKPYFCYMLMAHEAGRTDTYVGVSVDLNHRLRQHNGEIKGGASATSIVVKMLQKRNRDAGTPDIVVKPWTRLMHVRGFPSAGEALRFEWRWKNLTKSEGRRVDPVVRRFRAVQRLLALEKATAKGGLFSEFETPLEVVCESEWATSWWATATHGTMNTAFGSDARASEVIPYVTE